MKENLNGHYCLNTEEHRRKLEETMSYLGNYARTAKYLFIHGGRICGSEEIQNFSMMATEPMHLHNNEWVLGSLEHEDLTPRCQCGGEVIAEHEGSKYFGTCVECEGQTRELFFESDMAIKAYVDYPSPKKAKIVVVNGGDSIPKQVQRITREEMIEAFDGRENGYSGHIKFMDKIADYIEYLEATQKDSDGNY